MYLNTVILKAYYKATYYDFNRELCTWILLFEKRTIELNTLIWTVNYVPEYCYLNRNICSWIPLLKLETRNPNTIILTVNYTLECFFLTPKYATSYRYFLTGLCSSASVWHPFLGWVWREAATLTVIHCFYFHESKTERKGMNSTAQRMFVRGSISLLFVVTKEEEKLPVALLLFWCHSCS